MKKTVLRLSAIGLVIATVLGFLVDWHSAIRIFPYYVSFGDPPYVNICNRTEQVRDTIMRAVEAKECDAVDLKRMQNIQGLDLRDKGLTTLASGDFAGLTGLVKLDLDNNQLTALPSGAFAGLTNLKTIEIKNNQLTALPSGAFAGLANLETIRLRKNQLTALPIGVFANLPALKVLNVKDNHLVGLPEQDYLSLAGVHDEVRVFWGEQG